MKNKKTLESGVYGKLFLQLCVPTVIIMLVMVIYNMADIFFIGRLHRAELVAALSMSMPVFTILSGIGTLLGSGGCTAISIALGKGDTAACRKYTAFCWFGTLLTGILFGAAALGMKDQVCTLLGANAETFLPMRRYLTVMCFGAPVILLNNVYMNLIRADGSAIASMGANLIGTGLNIILDPILIQTFGLEVSGAAWATVIGNAVSLIYLLLCIRRRKAIFSFAIRDLQDTRKTAGRVLSLGLPLSISTLLMSVSTIVGNQRMLHYGADAVAAQSVVGKMAMLITMLVMGICMGLQPAVSYNFGAGRMDRVAAILKKTAALTVILGIGLMSGMLLFQKPLISAFLSDPAVVALGRKMFPATIAIGPFYGLYQLCQTYLQSTGKASYATWVSMLDKGLILIPMQLAMSSLWGMNGLIWAAPVTTVLSLLSGAVLSLRWHPAAPAAA